MSQALHDTFWHDSGLSLARHVTLYWRITQLRQQATKATKFLDTAAKSVSLVPRIIAGEEETIHGHLHFFCALLKILTVVRFLFASCFMYNCLFCPQLPNTLCLWVLGSFSSANWLNLN